MEKKFQEFSNELEILKRIHKYLLSTAEGIQKDEVAEARELLGQKATGNPGESAMSFSNSGEPLGGIDATKEALHLSTDPTIEEEITHISCFVVRLEELLASRL
jgi:hypothetical protein